MNVAAISGSGLVDQRATTGGLIRGSSGKGTCADFHANTRQAEIEQGRSNNMIAVQNSWKGYTPSVRQSGSAVVLEDASKQVMLESNGFVRIGSYQGDSCETYQGKRGYYQSTVGGQNAFRQAVPWEGTCSALNRT